MTVTIKLSDIVLRCMTTSDIADVLHIEQNAQLSPWARLSFEEALTRDNICRVMTIKNQICGYYIVSAILDELHILNIVCAPKVQGLGLGHRLMEGIINEAQGRAVEKMFLEVRVGNLVAQNLYKKWNFKQIAVRKNYYRASSKTGEKEDALVFVRIM